MRSMLLALLCALALTGVAAAEDPGVITINQVKSNDLSALASGKTPLTTGTVTYLYQNMYGIRETWQVTGTRVIHHKSVHTAAFIDMARRKVVGGSSLTPVDQQVLDLEYGEYDKYFEGTIDAAAAKQLYSGLVSSDLIGAPARPGCGETYWEINLQVGSKVTQKFDVNAPGNPRFSDAVTTIQNIVGAVPLTPIDHAAFESNFKKSNISGGITG